MQQKLKADRVDSRGRPRVQTINTDPSMTVQSDAHLADIQNIMKTFGAEADSILDEAELMYADVSDFTDLADALNQAKEADVDFKKLPSKVRELFDHDVVNWLDTAHDPDKREAMHDVLVEKGFIKSEEVVKAVVEPTVEGTPKGSTETGSGSE